MSQPVPSRRHLRFGPFELDLRTKELRKGSARLKVPDQSIQILEALLEQAGELVTREQLRDRLWPSATYVDFDRGLNAAVRRLRDALGDDADTPIYIETLPRRGYRFVGPVDGPQESAAPEALVHTIARGAAPPSLDTPANSSAVPTARPAAFRSWTLRSPLLVSSGAAAGVFATLLWHASGGHVAHRADPPTRFEIRLDPDLQLVSPPALSHDGRRIVYAARDAAHVTRVYLRALDKTDAVPLPGTDGGRFPFLSPDGGSIGFLRQGILERMTLPAGAATTIWINPYRTGFFCGASWGADDSIVFATNYNVRLRRVPAGGGPVEAVTTQMSASDDVGHLWPQQLPGGRGILFTTSGRAESEPFKISVQAAGERLPRDLVDVGRMARFVPPGHLVYSVASTLMVAPFDLPSLRITGAAVPMPEQVLGIRLTGSSFFDISPSGTLVYAEGRELVPHSTPVWVDATGSRDAFQNPLSDAWHLDPTASPTYEQVAFSVIHGVRQDIWLYDLRRSTWTRLTTTPAGMAPVWMDNGRLAFTSRGEAALDLFSIAADGSGTPELLLASGHDKYASSWSPRAKLLAFMEQSDSTNWDISLLDLSGEPRREVFLNTRFQEGAPDLSPDGRWLAYESDESGRMEVYVRPVRHAGGRWAISTQGGAAPRWSPDGRRLFYIGMTQLMAVPVSTDRDEFVPGAPAPAAQHPYYGGAIANYQPFPDGRVLMMREETTVPSPRRLIVVQNWLSEVPSPAALRTSAP